MAALAESVGLEHLSLAGLSTPITIRLPEAIGEEDLIAFSRRNKPYRIEQNARGELEIMSPVGGDGSEIEATVIRDLGIWTAQHGGHFFSSNGGFRLPDSSVLSPDAAWISDERWSTLSREQRRKYPPLCPEFLIEVLSESDSPRLLEDKMGLWIANGAQLGWMIDPFAATVSIYRPGVEVEVLEGPEMVEAHSVVTGFRLATSRLWNQ